MKQFNRSLAAASVYVLSALLIPIGASAAGTMSGNTMKMVETGHSVIKLPVYPGAKNDATKHISMDDGTGMYSLEGYTTHDSVDTVYAWYASRLTSGWTNKILHYNGTSTGALKMEDAKVSKSILISRYQGVTTISMTEKDKK